MSESKKIEEAERGLFGGLIEALGDKHSQLDINFQHAKMNLIGAQIGLEMNGVVSLTVHMRDLTEDEKKASAEKNVVLMSSK